MGSQYHLKTVLAVLCSIVAHSYGGITSPFVRSPLPSSDIPIQAFPPPPGLNAPEQVHITQGDYVGRSMIVSWVTPLAEEPNTVTYWAAEKTKTPWEVEEHKHHRHHKHRRHRQRHSVNAIITTYTYSDYRSGYIHHATITKLQYDTKYFYQIGNRTFSFTTPPELGPDVPYTFGIIGDLGQTYDSNQTLEHYVANPKGQTMLCAGDLSYADHFYHHDNRKWDSWGRFIEKSTAYQPWIWTAGNHELDYAPEIGETTPFKPYLHRYATPYEASNSDSPLWYAIKRASAHIIVLSSYSAYGKYTPQYNWLQNELSRVNRSETPWLIVLVHSPWYNSVNYHYMEGETMRVQFESWLVDSKVDIVFAGHVHAYERTERISNVRFNLTNRLCTPIRDINAPVYITIGDGGNIEGIANSFTDPQPEYSAFREASFGHAVLEIKNRTHAYYTWHRNHDGEPVAADRTWLFNRHWYPEEERV